MKTVSLQHDQAQYAAISYAWTKSEPTCHIQIQPISVRIRPNLHDFLKMARKGHRQDWMFVDALCIDQGSVPEPNDQVALMGAVYRDAARVVVWLGHPAISDLETFEKAQINLPKHDIGRHRLCSVFDLHGHTLYLSAKFFLPKQYWSRVWIVQELLLASAVTFRAGPLSLDWEGGVVLLTEY